MAGTRQDQYMVSVSINGNNYGVWDKLSGGDIDSEETKYNPGAMGAAVSLGGRKTVTNVTVARLYDLQRDHHLAPGLIAMAGKANMTVTKQPLDADGNTFGEPIVYTGKLKMVQLPEHDSESNSAAMVTLEMSSAGTVA